MKFALIFAAFTAAAPTCPSYLVLMARGTGEVQQNPPATGSFGEAVMSLVPGGMGVQAEYDSSPNYLVNVDVGAKDVIKKVGDFVALCGMSTPIVLFGYSLGAWVVTRALEQGMPQANISSIHFWGNPTRQSMSAPYHAQNRCGCQGSGQESLLEKSFDPSWWPLITDCGAPLDIVACTVGTIAQHTSAYTTGGFGLATAQDAAQKLVQTLGLNLTIPGGLPAGNTPVNDYFAAL